MNQAGNEFYERFRHKTYVNRAIASEWHSHFIVPWAVEEKCVFCSYPASHKVEEDGAANPGMHPYTAYVCCQHFWGPCNNTKVIMRRTDWPDDKT